MQHEKPADNVLAFLDKASDAYGQMMCARFTDNLYCEIVEGESRSPIEHLFLIASQVLCASEYVPYCPDPEFDRNGDPVPARGLHCWPQAPIGKYKVDFLLSQSGLGPEEIYTPVVVELDGHEFHDKDKRQRSYEKARDRFLVKRGYKVLHFTGSDVVADPYRVAFEALEMLGVFLGSRDEYDPKNPLGL